MNKYQDLIRKHQKDIDDFPMFFAFNDEQFEEGMRSIGLEPDDTGAIYKLGNTGGFFHKTDEPAFSAMMERHDAEMKEAIDADQTGDGFIYEMFDYELSNHEYSYSRDLTSTLEALGFSAEEINASAKLKHGLKIAIKNQFNEI